MRRPVEVTTLAVTVLVLAGCAVPGLPDVRSGEPAGAAGTVWVANEGDDSLSALDAATGLARATLTGVPAPHNVQAAADGRAVWAVSASNRVLALDGGSLVVTGMAATDRHPAHVVAGAGGHIHVTASDQSSVYTYDARLRPVRRTPLTGAPHGLRTSADGRTAVIANGGTGAVDVVDLLAGRIAASIPVGPQPVQVAVDARATVAHVSLAGTREVVRVDLAGRTVTHRATVPAAPAQVLLVGDLVLSADQGSREAPGDTVSLLRAADLGLVARIRVGSGPHGLTADPSGRRAWVTNTFDGTVTELDLTTRTTVRTVPVGAAPNGISFSPLTARPAGTLDLALPEGGHDDTASGDHTHAARRSR